jgi:hypothetical protein
MTVFVPDRNQVLIIPIPLSFLARSARNAPNDHLPKGTPISSESKALIRLRMNRALKISRFKSAEQPWAVDSLFLKFVYVGIQQSGDPDIVQQQRMHIYNRQLKVRETLCLRQDSFAIEVRLVTVAEARQRLIAESRKRQEKQQTLLSEYSALQTENYS